MYSNRIGTNAGPPITLCIQGQAVHRHPLQPMTVMNPLPLDPQAAMSIAQYGYAQLLHGPGTRKNATRESTTSLKNWLKEHQKNPYPTKAEKVYLALVSGNYNKHSKLYHNLYKNIFILFLKLNIY